MPELPEVETTRRGLEPHVVGKRIERIAVREPRLRWPVTVHLEHDLSGCVVRALERRAKYLLMRLDTGSLLVHLGMSGSLRYLPAPGVPGKHDHVDIELGNGGVLRYNDPRRFGSMHFTTDPASHPLLQNLGPEPLGDAFSGRHLWTRSRARRAPVKSFIMDGRVVVGVGNIYASEALHRAGIHPLRAAGRISLQRFERLAAEIRDVLEQAILSGGTTLRDFVGGDGRPGYFRQSLTVYERAGQPCRGCGHDIQRRVIGQRASYYCARCQR